MESLILSSSSSSTISNGLLLDTNHTLNPISRNGFNLSFPFSSQNLSFSRKSVILSAKKNNYDKKKKEDRHSFVPKEDETTGLFPESVLLKQKVLQEDGKLLPDFADDDEPVATRIRDRHYEVVYLIHENFEEDVEKVNLKVQ
ncbi:SET-like protein, partial [Tanacetum coccineum]